MKKLIMSTVFGLTFFCCSAQIERGAILLGGSSNFNHSNVRPSDGSSESITNINLKGGYFLAQNFALGLNYGYTNVASASLTTIGFFGRHYPAGRFFLGAGYNSSSTSFGNFDTGMFTAEGGYAAFVGRNVAFEPAINFTSGDGFTIIGFAVGINVYLNRGE